MASNRTVLIAAAGMSPAVLSETVWALAREEHPIIPDEVVAITTTRAAKDIRRALIESGEWERLTHQIDTSGRLRFGSAASIQIIGDGLRDFSDLTTAEENERAADFILRIVRQYSEDSSVRIIASIAGGRKTMGALLLSCMSLLGRDQDRVCHVLANDQYIRDHVGFLFPKNDQEAKHAKIKLADIPFIRVRGIYEKMLGKAPASYSALVRQFSTRLPPAVVELPVAFCSKRHELCIDGTIIRLSTNEYTAAEAFVRDRLAGRFTSLDELAGEVFPGSLSTVDEFRRYISNVRKKLRDAGYPELCDRLLPPAKDRNYHYRQIRFRTGRPGTSE